MNDKYIPLYRKYRPQRLEEIVGQEHIKKALANAVTTGRISHAYLFTGPRGTGKTSTARIFAKSLNCVNGPTINPCGTCSNCVDITNSVPMDVIEIDAASNRKVEDAQNILEKVMYAPVNSRYKIYIIDEVHMLSNTAFNALLKTLEEPPKNVIFILATTEVHKVLDTIKSRCQRFDFKRITTDDIVNHLKDISEKEKINITDDALSLIAKNSAGGMRDSIALLDQLSILNSTDTPISVDDINNLLGRISFDILKELTDAIISSDSQLSVSIVEKIYNSGNEPAQIFANLLDYIKNLLIVKNSNEAISSELTQFNENQIKVTSKQAELLETHQIVALIDKISDYIKIIKTSDNPRLWLEVGIIDVANLSENTKLQDIQNRLSLLEGNNPQVQNNHSYTTAPSPISTVHKIKEQLEPQLSKNTDIQPETLKEVIPINKSENAFSEESGVLTEEFSPMPKSKPVESDDIALLWGQLLSNIPSVPTVTLLKQWANPVKISPDETVITIKTEMFLNRVESGNKKDMVIAAVNKLFSQNNSKVVIRLPLPDDVNVKPILKTPPKNIPKNTEPEPIITQEEVSEAVSEISDKTETKEEQIKNYAGIGHSDQVNMAVDLFDGKIID